MKLFINWIRFLSNYFYNEIPNFLMIFFIEPLKIKLMLMLKIVKLMSFVTIKSNETKKRNIFFY